MDDPKLSSSRPQTPNRDPSSKSCRTNESAEPPKTPQFGQQRTLHQQHLLCGTMSSNLPPTSKSKLVIRYSGEKLEARQADGKVWFAVDGQAILTRQQQQEKRRVSQQVPIPTVDVTASIHVILDGSSTIDSDGQSGESPSPPQHSAASCSPQESALLVKAAQLSPAFPAVTALSPGIHIMCHVPRTGSREEVGDKQAKSADRWSALWDDLRASPDAGEATKRLVWQAPCLRLLSEAGRSLGSQAIASLADGVRTKGWALVPCTSSENSACALARAGGAVDGGKVAWLHLNMDETGMADYAAAGAASAIADSLLVASDDARHGGPTYSSISAHHHGVDDVEVLAEAHRVLHDGVLSGYDLNILSPKAGIDQGASSGETAHSGGPSVDDVLFIDESTTPSDIGGNWRGNVATEELPGGGLHRHVRIKLDASCAGKACVGLSGGGQSEWCEILLAQHVPQGAYIDVDEVKARHDFDVRSSPPSGRRVGVETFDGEPIDVELPASVSGQHVVNFDLWVDMSTRRGREEARVQAEMTLPVHLRYPDPGCEQRGEDCDQYAWVKVPPPLASIRCGGAGDTGPFSPILPSMPPLGVALSVPRGIVWHRGFVMWGTVWAAALGCLYTIWTLLSINSVVPASDSDRKRR